MKLDSKTLDQIGQAVAEVEKQSALEIVPCFVSRSSPYRTFRLGSMLFVWALTLLALLVRDHFFVSAALESWNFSQPTLLENLLVPMLTTTLAAILFAWPAALRRFLPERLKRRKVIQAARRYFLEYEVFATEQRTGVLLLISEFERQIYVLADKGVSKHIADERWQSLGELLAADFSAGRPGDSFVAALRTLAAEIAPHFPAPNKNDNELSDQVRQPKQSVSDQ